MRRSMEQRNKMINQLNILIKLLMQMCHAPKCKNLSLCPEGCGCKKIRKFKLNTETALCWELATQIRSFIHNTHYLKREYNIRFKTLHENAIIFERLTLYHSSKGWRTFFLNIKKTILSIDDSSKYFLTFEDRIYEFKKSTPRLKRTPIK